MTATTSQLLRRIQFDPGSKLQELNPIPWPQGLAPTPADPPHRNPEGALPAADVVIVTYTTAEGRSLADVLTPGVQSTDWVPYTKDWAAYEPLLDSRSPALESRRLGSWYLSSIGTRTALCFKSELHPATDGPRLPIVRLWSQIVGDVAPKLLITSGTAGGVGLQTELGDVAVPAMVRWNCQEQFESEPWAHAAYATSALSPAMAAALGQTGELIAANADRIPAQYRQRPIKVWQSGTVMTTDFFAWGDTSDHFGLLKAAPDCVLVEMDDAALALARQSMNAAPPFLSVRNASDPVMPGEISLEQQRSQAEDIYEQYGYFTTLGSAIVCWAISSAV
jgi:nucleoside phosphorylase